MSIRIIVGLLLCLLSGVACVGERTPAVHAEGDEGAACWRRASGIEVRLNVYYLRLDSSRDIAPMLRSGRYPHGWFCVYDTLRPTGAELEQLRQMLSRLKPVPREPQDGGTLWPILREGENRARGASVSLLFEGRDLAACNIANLQRDIVRESEQRKGEGLYYLPDADYKALMRLPCIREAYARLQKYKDDPAAFLKSRLETSSSL